MGNIQTFSDEQIISLRKGGAILRSCLEHVATLVRPGTTTAELDREAEEFIRSRGALPAFKGYRGYPATLCTSYNDECVHGIPGDRTLEEGDILSIDCGVILDTLYTDACITVPVGTISEEAGKLLAVDQDALRAGIARVHAGAHIGDISCAIQSTVEGAGFTIVKALQGHGLGSTLHQPPDVPNWGKPGTGPILPLHTIIAIEPIVAVGSGEVRETGDGWTLATKDGSLSSHFEHTVLVTERGCEILA